MTSDKTDPVLVAILSNRTKAIAEEMARTLMMTSRSGIFAEARDFITAIFDKDLRLIAQSDYFPGFAGALPYILPPLIEKFGEDIDEGDIFIVNDPYAGNSHIPDMNVIKPVFWKGGLEFWATCKGHMADIGAGGVAGYDPDGTSIWDEGLIIPPTKLYHRGELYRDLWEILLRNVKATDLVSGDIMCEVGGANIGERGLIKLLDRYGPEMVHSHLSEFLAASEREIREKISR
ncbi:MAG: hydantoinase B/oxoprolinase family protein, partial [Deltaproteobacteria bacterium]|nr:hydantoinase B/oxoprolinase family protein [Deltaproteobacteria bacterium]